MSPWAWLAAAILAEIVATSALKLSDGFQHLNPSVVVVLGYSLAFVSLSRALQGLPLGLAYAVWSGVGTLGAVLVGRALFGEALAWQQVLGMLAVIGGVALMHSAKV